MTSNCILCGSEQEETLEEYTPREVFAHYPEIFIPTKPTPASRPRISRYGNYYPKGYTEFRTEIYKFLRKLKIIDAVDDIEFRVELEVICKKPKKPSNPYPRGDVDNYAKAYLDSLTYAKLFWVDDIQVVELHVSKRYQEEGEDYGAKLSVAQLTSI